MGSQNNYLNEMVLLGILKHIMVKLMDKKKFTILYIFMTYAQPNFRLVWEKLNIFLEWGSVHANKIWLALLKQWSFLYIG